MRSWFVSSCVCVAMLAACQRYYAEDVGDGGVDAPSDAPGSDAGDDATVSDGADGSTTPDADADARTFLGCNGVQACPRTIFATVMTWNGNLGGLAGADLKCQNAADASPLPAIQGKRFVAWLSDATTSASARHPHGTASYANGGTKVAMSWVELVSGTLMAPIDTDENGGVAIGDAWTGTEGDGSAATFHCASWTATTGAEVGVFGETTRADVNWTKSAGSTCDPKKRLYCIEY